MEKSEVQRKVQLATSEEVFRKTGRIFVPVASSMCICAMRMSSACSGRATS